MRIAFKTVFADLKSKIEPIDWFSKVFVQKASWKFTTKKNKNPEMSRRWMETSGTTPMADSVWRSQSWLIDVNRQARLNLMVAGGRMLALVAKHQAQEDISHKKQVNWPGPTWLAWTSKNTISFLIPLDLIFGFPWFVCGLHPKA